MSRVVFVGNIPFEMSEEQIIDIFKEVGPVVAFRLMFDRETGKPRGFGFCEFTDAETANSAIRNLNGYDVGGRALIVNTADNDASPAGFPSSAPAQSVHSSVMHQPPAPPSLPVSQPMTGTPSFGIETVNAVLSSLSNQQLSDTIMHFKNLAANNPAQASTIFQHQPALAYALFQALINMRLVDPNVVQELYNQQQTITTDSSFSVSMSRPQPTNAYVPTPSPPPAAEDQHRAMIAQIMSLTDEQINALPDEQRKQVLMVRAQLAGGTT